MQSLCFSKGKPSLKILIVKISAFGDVVHTMPILPVIKKLSPDSVIYWAVDTRFVCLLEDNPYLDGVYSLPMRRWNKPFAAGSVREATGLIKAMRSQRFDLCIDVQGNLKSGVVSFLSGAKLRYGFDRGGVREMPNLLFTNRKVPLLKSDVHISRRILRVVTGAVGDSIEGVKLYPSIFIPAGLREDVRKKMGMDSGKINIAIHHGTTWETKRLSGRKWTAIVSALLSAFGADNMDLYFTWGDGEEERVAKDIIEGFAARKRNPLRLVPSLTIRELAAFFSLMDVTIGPDTGPVHLAAAIGGKTLSFYRATRGDRNAPVGPSHRYIQASVECTGCLKKECADTEKCEDGISVEEIVEKARELLKL